MSTAEFYDGLADTYHVLYPDWVGEGRAQAEALHRLLGRWHRGPADIADIACGIGTQLIGLAGLGHRLLGSDTSLRAVQRARRECAAAGRHRDGLDQGLRPDPGQPSRQHPAAGLRVWQRPRDTYRAYTRAALSELATAAGLQDIRWHTPLDTNFFQPVMTAHSPT